MTRGQFGLVELCKQHGSLLALHLQASEDTVWVRGVVALACTQLPAQGLKVLGRTDGHAQASSAFVSCQDANDEKGDKARGSPGANQCCECNAGRHGKPCNKQAALHQNRKSRAWNLLRTISLGYCAACERTRQGSKCHAQIHHCEPCGVHRSEDAATKTRAILCSGCPYAMKAAQAQGVSNHVLF